MIDPSIILRGAEWQQDMQQRNMQALQNLGGNLRNAAVKHAASNLLKLESPEQQQEFIKNSRFAPELTELLAAKQKTALDTQKTLAEIGKITADAGKLTADSAATSQKATIDRQKARNSAVVAALSGGNPSAAMFLLDDSAESGLIDQDTRKKYQSFLIQNHNNPEAIASIVKSLGVGVAENPEQYLMADANNVNTNATSIANNTLDNATSRANNADTVSASRYATDQGAEVKREQLSQDQQQFNTKQAYEEQKAYFEQNKPQKYAVGSDGYQYALFADGSGMRVVGQDGQPIKAQVTGKGAETPVQRMERVEKVQDFATSAQAAAEGAKLAESLGKNIGVLNKTAGGFGLAARVPGTDAKAFATQLETMKSQVFLNQIARMKGSGALSDAEGKKLDSALASLDLGLSPADLQANLFEISRILAGVAHNSRNKARVYSGKTPVASPRAPTSNNGNKPNARSFFE